jgi:uncharacterized protein YndB with AHSA1/START domain
VSEPVPKIRSVVVERELSAPPEKIWRALTVPHLIEEWLMKNDFKPIAGHHFNLSRAPTPEQKVTIECEVVEVEPNKTLSYTWSAFGTDTVVTFTLTPTVSGKTQLRVEQNGFRPDQELAFRGATTAWKQFMRNLEGLLDQTDSGQTPSPTNDTNTETPS